MEKEKEVEEEEEGEEEKNVFIYCFLLEGSWNFILKIYSSYLGKVLLLDIVFIGNYVTMAKDGSFWRFH